MTLGRIFRYVSSKILWGVVYLSVFLVSFCGSAIQKMSADPLRGAYSASTKEVGAIYHDLPYGAEESQRYDLYLPQDATRRYYGLVVALQSGAIASGDKKNVAELLQWFASKGYVAAGINYTLLAKESSKSNVYRQYQEIKNAIPKVVTEANRRGFAVDRMAITGGSSGGTLALLYAYRDAKTAPAPVKFVFETSGPASFRDEDWARIDPCATPSGMADLFSRLSGEEITTEMIVNGAYSELMRPIAPDKWVDADSPATLLAHGAQDKVCPVDSARTLVAELKKHGTPHDYYEFPHSGHALQNDRILLQAYMEKLEDYLWKYMPNY